MSDFDEEHLRFIEKSADDTTVQLVEEIRRLRLARAESDAREYAAGEVIESAVWLHTLRFTHESDWLSAIRKELDYPAWGRVMRTLADIKSRHPSLPICMAFSDIVRGYILSKDTNDE